MAIRRFVRSRGFVAGAVGALLAAVLFTPAIAGHSTTHNQNQINNNTQINNQQANRLTAQRSTIQGLRIYAVVDSTGTLARGAKVDSVTRVGTGTYEVTFTRDVDGCSWDATVGDPADGSPTIAFPTVALATGTTDTVRVQAFSDAGGNVDSGFHLQVDC